MDENTSAKPHIEPWDDWKEEIPKGSAEPGKPAIDYSQSPMFRHDVAYYLPAISETYVRMLENRTELFAGLYEAEDLQFTNPKTSLFSILGCSIAPDKRLRRQRELNAVTG